MTNTRTDTLWVPLTVMLFCMAQLTVQEPPQEPPQEPQTPLELAVSYTDNGPWMEVKLDTDSFNKLTDCVCIRDKCSVQDVVQRLPERDVNIYIRANITRVTITSNVMSARSPFQYFACNSSYVSSRTANIECKVYSAENKDAVCQLDTHVMSSLLNIVCSVDTSVIIAWTAPQMAGILKYDETRINLLNCSGKTTSTITQTTGSSLTISKTTTATPPAPTTLTTTTVADVAKVSPTTTGDALGPNHPEHNIPSGSVPVTDSSTMTWLSDESTGDTSSRQDSQEDGDKQTVLNDFHIGIIVGTAVISVLITLFVVFCIQKVKNKRRAKAARDCKSTRNTEDQWRRNSTDMKDIYANDLDLNTSTSDQRAVNTSMSDQRAVNTFMSDQSAVNTSMSDQRAVNTSMSDQSAVAQVTPLQSVPALTPFKMSTDNYVDIDIGNTRNTSIFTITNNTNTNTADGDDLHVYPKESELEGHSIYSRLGEPIRIFHNPYNILPTENKGVSTQPQGRGTQAGSLHPTVHTRTDLRRNSGGSTDIDTSTSKSNNISVDNPAEHYMNSNNLEGVDKTVHPKVGKTNRPFVNPHKTLPIEEEAETCLRFPVSIPKSGSENPPYDISSFKN